MEDYKKDLRIKYFEKYKGILPEKTISDSADWLIEFIEPYISQARTDVIESINEKLNNLLTFRAEFKGCEYEVVTKEQIMEVQDLLKSIGGKSEKENNS